MRRRLKDWAEALKRDSLALYYASRDPRTPWYAKLLAALVVGYVLSPIDLIPDFVPLIGYLDDMLLVPLGIALTLRLVPHEVLEEARGRAARTLERPRIVAAAVIIVAVWFALGLVLTVWLVKLVQ